MFEFLRTNPKSNMTLELPEELLHSNIPINPRFNQILLYGNSIQRVRENDPIVKVYDINDNVIGELNLPIERGTKGDSELIADYRETPIGAYYERLGNMLREKQKAKERIKKTLSNN